MSELKRAEETIKTLLDQMRAAENAWALEHKLCADLTLELAAKRVECVKMHAALLDARWKILSSKIPGSMGTVNRINKILASFGK